MKSEKKVLVTGATGFIGSHLVKKLVSTGSNVHIFARRNSKFWRIDDIASKIHVHTIDLNESSKLHREVLDIRPDIVYHLAAYGVNYNEREPQLLFNTNVSATVSLLEALSECNVSKLLIAGSCFEYGNISGSIDEGMPLDPVNLYGVSKAAEAMVTKIIAKKYGIPYIVCRPFGVYGPYESPNRIIPYVLLSIMDGKPLKLTGGKQLRDYTYVEDIAEAFIKASASKAENQIINICSGIPIELKKLVNKAIEVAGVEPDIEWGALSYRPDETLSLVGDNLSAKTILKWEPKTPLREGLNKTYEWFKDNRGLYNK
ncbi:MAG: SDR family NAD(P)-dependent oxidoreductase [Candidatus Omnitrophota bacterium]|nr:MAG: SDR family NAD(P)-dependent oxidoreductase [Candidatus Omnitrophota bacterium]